MAKKENKNDNKVKKHFLKDFKAELKKVIWPTPKQLVNNTVAVVVIVLITVVIVLALDSIFDLGNKYGIVKLQSIVKEKFVKEDENKTNENNSEVKPEEGKKEENNSESKSEEGNTEANKNENEKPVENQL